MRETIRVRVPSAAGKILEMEPCRTSLLVPVRLHLSGARCPRKKVTRHTERDDFRGQLAGRGSCRRQRSGPACLSPSPHEHRSAICEWMRGSRELRSSGAIRSLSPPQSIPIPEGSLRDAGAAAGSGAARLTYLIHPSPHPRSGSGSVPPSAQAYRSAHSPDGRHVPSPR